MDTKQGNIILIVAVVIAIIGVGGVMLFGKDKAADLAKEQAMSAAEKAAMIAKEKGSEVMEEHGDAMLEKGKEMVKEQGDAAMEKVVDAAQDVKEDAMAEGKKMVGDAIKEVGENMAADAGTYGDYTPEAIAVNGGAVLDFYASWCPTCRALEANIKENVDKIPAGVSILKVDFDTEKELAKKYGVTQQHTLVQVDADGNQIAKWVGSPTLSALVSKIQ